MEYAECIKCGSKELFNVSSDKGFHIDCAQCGTSMPCDTDWQVHYREIRSDDGELHGYNWPDDGKDFTHGEYREALLRLLESLKDAPELKDGPDVLPQPARGQ